MRMMVKKVGEPVQEVDLPNKYDTLRDAVGGLIESVYLENKVILWVNEEGKLNGSKHNFSVGNNSIEGDVIFTADDGRGGTKSLTDKQVKYIKGLLDETPSEFQKYIDRFFSEKDLPVDVWTFSEGNYFAAIDNQTVIATMRNEKNPSAQLIIRKTLMTLDFMNSDVNKYLRFVAEQMFKRDHARAKTEYGGLVE